MPSRSLALFAVSSFGLCLCLGPSAGCFGSDPVLSRSDDAGSEAQGDGSSEGRDGSVGQGEAGGGGDDAGDAGHSGDADLRDAPDGADAATTNDPSCLDATHNNGETDVDCGGSICSPCAVTQMCLVNSDCTTGNCNSMRCR